MSASRLMGQRLRPSSAHPSRLNHEVGVLRKEHIKICKYYRAAVRRARCEEASFAAARNLDETRVGVQ